MELSESHIIRTPRFLLRRLSSEDAQKLYQDYDEKTVMKVLGIATEKEYERLRHFCFSSTPQRTYMLFMIHDIATNQHIGSCNFHIWMIDHARGEIGYMIVETHRRQGIAKEAIRHVITYGFETMNLNRVEAFVEPANEPSLKLVRHFGFTQEGYLREHYCRDGNVEDSLCFSLLRREYFVLKDKW